MEGDMMSSSSPTESVYHKVHYGSVEKKLQFLLKLGRQGVESVFNKTLKLRFSEKSLKLVANKYVLEMEVYPDVLTKVIRYLGQQGKLEYLEFVNRKAGDYIFFAPDNWISVIFDLCRQCKPIDSPFQYLKKFVIHGSYGCEEQLSYQVMFILYLLKSNAYLPELQHVIISNLEKQKENIELVTSPYLLSPLRYITKGTFDMIERMKQLNPPSGCKKFEVVELKGFLELLDTNNNCGYKPARGFTSDEKKDMEFQLTQNAHYFRDLEDVYVSQMSGQRFIANRGIKQLTRSFPITAEEVYEKNCQIHWFKVTKRSLNRLQCSGLESLVTRFKFYDFHCMWFKPQGPVQNYYSISRASTLFRKDKAPSDKGSMKTSEIRVQEILLLFHREIDGIRTLKHPSVINDLGLSKGLHAVEVRYSAPNFGNFSDYSSIVDYFCHSIEARENLQKHFLKELKGLIVCIHYNYKYLIPRLYFHPVANVHFNYDREFFLEWMNQNHPKKLASVLNHYFTSSESLLHTLLQYKIYNLPLRNPENNKHLLGLKIHLLPQSILDIFYPLQQIERNYLIRSPVLLSSEKKKYLEMHAPNFRINNTAKFYFCLGAIVNFLCHRTFQIYDLMDPDGNFGRYEAMTCDIIVLRRYVNKVREAYRHEPHGTGSYDHIEELITNITRKRQSIDFFSDFCSDIEFLCDSTQPKIQKERTNASIYHEEAKRIHEDSFLFPGSENPTNGSPITGKSYLQHQALCGNLKSFTELQSKKSQNFARALFQDPEYSEKTLNVLNAAEEKTDFKYFLPPGLVPELPPIFILFRDFSLKELFFELAEEANAEDTPFCLPSFQINRSSAFKGRIKFNKKFKSRMISQWDCRARRISHDFPLFVIIRNSKNSPGDVKTIIEYFGLGISDIWITTSMYTGDFPLLYICRNYQIGYLDKLGFFQDQLAAPILLLKKPQRYTTSKPHPSVAETIYHSDFRVLQNTLYHVIHMMTKLETSLSLDL